jgi:hypothetical protein
MERSVDRAPPRSADGPAAGIGTGRELVVLVGGPLDRRWYWRDDLERQQATAARADAVSAGLAPELRPTWSPSSLPAYQPTEAWIDNPRGHGPGRVWTYTPDTQETPR